MALLPPRPCNSPDHEGAVVAPPFPDLLIKRPVTYSAHFQFGSNRLTQFLKLRHLRRPEKC